MFRINENGYNLQELDKKDLIYKVDSDGFLLDNENRYILDEMNRQIRLSTEHIQILR